MKTRTIAVATIAHEDVQNYSKDHTLKDAQRDAIQSLTARLSGLQETFAHKKLVVSNIKILRVVVEVDEP